jgi:hypothetical protein
VKLLAFQQAGEKGASTSLRSIGSLQRTSKVRFRSAIFRTPRSWTFLTSLILEFAIDN